jgi:hypothetical protein
MPSPERGAELERVIARAAEECEVGAVWFGAGLPQFLKRALEATGKDLGSDSPRLAFVEPGQADAPPASADRIVALSMAGLDELDAAVKSARGAKPKVARLISPVAVLDFIPEGIRIRELGPALTAAEIQKHLRPPLHAGPDLRPMRGQASPAKQS